MKKAYVALSFGDRKKLSEEISSIKNVLEENDYVPVVFVNDFSFPQNSSDKEMMDAALNEISESEILMTGYQVIGQDLKEPENIHFLTKLDDLISVIEEIKVSV